MDTPSPGHKLWAQGRCGGAPQGKEVEFGACACVRVLYMQAVRLLLEIHLQAGADANLQNNMGDTPLHKAAFTGRKVKQ